MTQTDDSPLGPLELMESARVKYSLALARLRRGPPELALLSLHGRPGHDIPGQVLRHGSVLLFKIANEPPTDILSVRADLPPGLVAFLDRAMAKEADERYQTGDEFAAALRAAFGSGPSAPTGGSVDMDISL